MDDQEWNVYLAEVDGHPASIFFNESLAERAPVAGYDIVIQVHLMMRLPQPNGLSSSEEFDALTAIEDALDAEVAKYGGIYAGRVTGNAKRELIYFAQNAEQVSRAVTTAMSLFPDYKYEIESRSDPNWDLYKFLYPTDQIRQGMLNRLVRESLEENGDPVTEPREIDHWAYFPFAESADAFGVRVAQLGYRVREVSQPEDPEPDELWVVQFFRDDTPQEGSFDEATVELFELARELGGRYDGWESPVIKPE